MSLFITSDPVKDMTGQEEFVVPTKVNCTQRNVVYGISCAKCDKIVYVGETERQLRERMKEHLRDVRQKSEKPINAHFSLTGHSEADLRFTTLKQMYTAERIERQVNETAWIHTLQTIRPLGCNVKDARYNMTLNDVQ